MYCGKRPKDFHAQTWFRLFVCGYQTFSIIEVFGEDGTRLFDFWATESSLKINGDFLEPTDENIKLPYKVPRVHAARNIGPETYHEILFESKFSAEDLNNPTRLSKKEL